MGRAATLPRPVVSPRKAVAPLESGDRLTRAEFERRYQAMPEHVKAELIEGVAYVASPVRLIQHGKPTARLVGWLVVYEASTPSTETGNNSTVRMDLDNEPQPDAFLRIIPECGGQSGTTPDGYVEGAPELVLEVAASTESVDLHDKLNAYRRNGVREYIVWRVLDGEIDWLVWRDERYERLSPDALGVYRSERFPGLWLDAPALLSGDLAKVLTVLQQGIESAEHRAFVDRRSGAA